MFQWSIFYRAKILLLYENYFKSINISTEFWDVQGGVEITIYRK